MSGSQGRKMAKSTGGGTVDQGPAPSKGLATFTPLPGAPPVVSEDRNDQPQDTNPGPAQLEEEGGDEDEDKELGDRPGGHSQGWGDDESEEDAHPLQIDELSPDEDERIVEQAGPESLSVPKRCTVLIL
ncbi:hypothetical protein C8J57DRAFT_1705593 [Mycena rebaudengoi]|nr:hypothetical protein C8J57DRAFT_1705593 [Mycena rebaudengoi]